MKPPIALKIKKFKELSFKRKALLVSIAGVIILAGAWIYRDHYITTDDAYVNANVATISPQITAKVIQVCVKNNQKVIKNQVLLVLDEAPFKIAMNQAKAQLTIAKAEWQNAKANADRMVKLLKQHAVSQQNHDDIITQLKERHAALALARTELAKAKLNLSYTSIKAPANGWLTNFKVQVGDIVQGDRPLFSIVQNDLFWVDANYKETELKKIKTGQAVTIAVDMYPGVKFKGVVDSVSFGSGAIFSLLPPQNATGNWVKITQRVPVKIIFIEPNPNYPLRIGTSAKVSIDINS